MVGYKQPPLHTRFKKGQSGNPKGRPKKAVSAPGGALSANRLALQEAERPIKVREGDDVREISTIEAVQRAQTKTAIGGNAIAQRDMLNRYGKDDVERRLQIADECAFWEGYIDICCAKMAEAQAKGEPRPKMIPHPDDIVVDTVKGVSINGPGTAEEAAAVEKALKIRDLLVMQCVFDERMRKGAKKNPTRVCSSLQFAFFSEIVLPKRLRLSDTALATQWMEYDCLTKRVLAKALYLDWRSVGLPLPRGRIFPLMDVSQHGLQTYLQKARGSTPQP